MSNEEIKKLIADSRAGVPEAFERLRDDTIDDLIDFLTDKRDLDRNEAEQLSDDLWTYQREIILRTTAEKGWNPDRESFVAYLARLIVTPKRNVRLVAEIAADPLPEPDRLLVDRYKYAFLLVQLFQKEIGEPHQQLAFLLMYQIGGKRTPRGMQGDAKMVHDRYGASALKRLLDIVRDDFMNLPGWQEQPGEAAATFEFASLPLAERMPGVEHTRFIDYYPGKNESCGPGSISEWCGEIKKKMQKALGNTCENWDEFEELILKKVRQKQHWWKKFMNLLRRKRPGLNDEIN